MDASLVRELGGAEYTSSFVGDESLGGSLADGFGGSSAGAEHFVDANDAVPRAYPHAASYVRLVNGLLAATAGSGAGPARDAGGASAAPFRFVRDDVFGRLATRPHASQTERWSMARDAITHFRLHLEIFAAEGFQAAFRSTDRDGSTMGGGGAVVPGGTVPGGRVPPPGGSTRPPGLDLMIDFLTDGPTIRGVLALLSVGADRLASERTHAHGEALEGAVLVALDLVVDALALDVACAERLGRVREFRRRRRGLSAGFRGDSGRGADTRRRPARGGFGVHALPVQPGASAGVASRVERAGRARRAPRGPPRARRRRAPRRGRRELPGARRQAGGGTRRRGF